MGLASRPHRAALDRRSNSCHCISAVLSKWSKGSPLDQIRGCRNVLRRLYILFSRYSGRQSDRHYRPRLTHYRWWPSKRAGSTTSTMTCTPPSPTFLHVGARRVPNRVCILHQPFRVLPISSASEVEAETKTSVAMTKCSSYDADNCGVGGCYCDKLRDNKRDVSSR